MTSLHEAGHPTGSAASTGDLARRAPDLDALSRVTGRVRASIEKVIEGKPEVARTAMVVLLSGAKAPKGVAKLGTKDED